MNWDTIVLSTIPYPLVGVGNVSVDIGKSNPLNSSTNKVLASVELLQLISSTIVWVNSGGDMIYYTAMVGMSDTY